MHLGSVGVRDVQTESVGAAVCTVYYYNNISLSGPRRRCRRRNNSELTTINYSF